MARPISDEVTRPADFSEAARTDVLSVGDGACPALVRYHERLEQQNAGRERVRRSLAAVPGGSPL